MDKGRGKKWIPLTCVVCCLFLSCLSRICLFPPFRIYYRVFTLWVSLSVNVSNDDDNVDGDIDRGSWHDITSVRVATHDITLTD